jgi:putative ATP-binding cassette transporter
MFFLPQRPYMTHGTLREQMLYPGGQSMTTVSDDMLETVLEKVNLADLGKRFGGFDIAMDWAQLLSLGEQQRLSFARLLLANPRYAVLDEATSALDIANEESLYEQLQASGMTYVSVGHRPSLYAFHDNVLELQGAGAWRHVTTAEF